MTTTLAFATGIVLGIGLGIIGTVLYAAYIVDRTVADMPWEDL